MDIKKKIKEEVRSILKEGSINLDEIDDGIIEIQRRAEKLSRIHIPGPVKGQIDTSKLDELRRTLDLIIDASTGLKEKIKV